MMSSIFKPLNERFVSLVDVDVVDVDAMDGKRIKRKVCEKGKDLQVDVELVDEVLVLEVLVVVVTLVVVIAKILHSIVLKCSQFQDHILVALVVVVVVALVDVVVVVDCRVSRMARMMATIPASKRIIVIDTHNQQQGR